MTVRILQQVGHNFKWNVDSFSKDKCGEGLILSPVHQDPSTVSALPSSVKKASIFDPQFYLPSSQKPKLNAYEFFPESIVGGFDTVSFEAAARDAARKCIAFQVNEKFRAITIPARFVGQMYTDFIERHERFSLLPFLEELPKGQKTPICFTLPLTDHMIVDRKFRNRILNWITKYPEIDELYVIYVIQDRELKQLSSAEFLSASLSFAREILDTGLGLTVGYQNSEALLFSLVENISVTMGTFENTRIFSIDKFLVSEEDRRGPRARIYLPGLLNWIQFDQSKSIRRNAPSVWKKIYRPTTYSEIAFDRPVDPYFNQPELYKHHLLTMYEDIRESRSLSLVDRFDWMRERVSTAIEHYGKILRAGVQLERHGLGAHLQPWMAALKDLQKGVS